MKKWLNEKYLRVAILAFAVAVASILFFRLLDALPALASLLFVLLFAARSVVFGILLALALYPLCRRLEDFIGRRIFHNGKKNLTHILGVSLTFIILVVVLAIITVSVLPMINENYNELSRTIEGYLTSAVNTLMSNSFIYNIFRALTGITGEDASHILQELLLNYSDTLSDWTQSMITLLGNILYSVADVLVAIILAFYFLLARGHIRGLIRKLAVAFLPRRFLLQTTRFFHNAYSNLIEFFSARLTCSFILGVMCYLFAFLFGIPFYPLISLIAMILNLFPALGPVAATLSCTLIVCIVKPQVAIPFFLLLIGLNILEQFLVEKYLLGKHLRLNVALALILVLASYLLLGVWAVIFVIPLFVTLRTEAQIFLARRLRKKGYSVDTGDYISPEGAEIYTPQPTPEQAAAQTTPSPDAAPEEKTENQEET